MKQKRTLILTAISFLLILFSISCSSAFTATISGTVKAEPRNNSSADEQVELSDANVYVFLDESEWNSFKAQWKAFSETPTSRSIVIPKPKAGKNVRTTNTNATGGFSVKTMWNTNSPLFGKDGDEKYFHLAVYHKDYGMFFDDTKHSVFSDSSQNISFICEYDFKQRVEYSIELNTLDYSNNNIPIALDTIDPKVVLIYSLKDVNGNTVSDIGKIKQIYEELPPTGSSFTFIADKYYYDDNSKKYTSTRVYPEGKIYFRDKSAEDEKEYKMCSEQGVNLQESGTPFKITDNSKTLKKDIYVDRVKRDYILSFDLQYPENDNNDYSGNAPTIQVFAPKTTIYVYFDGYNKATGKIETLTLDDEIEKGELYKTFTYSIEDVPENGEYSFTVNRMFDEHENEVFPSVTYLLEDDKSDIEYKQTDIDGNIFIKDGTLAETLEDYSVGNYSKTVDTYLDRVKLQYTIQFNLEDFEDGSTIQMTGEDNATETSFTPAVQLLILPYAGGDKDLETLDFTTGNFKTPDERLNDNTFAFEWDKYDDSGNIQYPAVKYYIYEKSNPQYYQVDKDSTGKYIDIKSKDDARTNVKTIDFRKGILNKEEDVYLRSKDVIFNLSFDLINLATDEQLTLAEVNPTIRLTYEDGNEAKEDIYHNVPDDGVYSIKVTRKEPISTDVTIDLEDTRNEVRYRLSDQTTYTTKDGANRYKLTHTLTKPNDNTVKLYIKDYKYPESLDFEGRFIDNVGKGINDHTVWLIPKIGSAFDEDDRIKLASPTKSVYKNESDSYVEENIDDGYFSTTYTQNRIGGYDEYPEGSKYLTQEFKIVVNSTKNQTSPQIEEDTDFMNTIEVKNDGQTSNYIYVDKKTKYKDN